jgi:hypothetical protein
MYLVHEQPIIPPTYTLNSIGNQIPIMVQLVTSKDERVQQLVITSMPITVQVTWRTPTLLERLKCKFSANNRRKRSWARSLVKSILKVKGHAGTLGWGLGRMISGSIIHMNMHKPNNKLVSAWLEHFWCTYEPWAYTDPQDSPWPELGCSHHFPPYSILCA